MLVEQFTWTFESTGAGAWRTYGGRRPGSRRRLSAEVPTGSTAHVHFQTSYSTESTVTAAQLPGTSTFAMTSSGTNEVQSTTSSGGLLMVRPYVRDLTAGGSARVVLFAVGDD